MTRYTLMNDNTTIGVYRSMNAARTDAARILGKDRLTLVSQSVPKPETCEERIVITDRVWNSLCGHITIIMKKDV